MDLIPNFIAKALRNSGNDLGHTIIAPFVITMLGILSLPYFLLGKNNESGDESYFALPFAVSAMLTFVALLLALSFAFAFSFAGIAWYVTAPIAHYATLFTICAVNKTGIWP